MERVSLLISKEEFDDGVGLELHLVHVGVLVLQNLTDTKFGFGIRSAITKAFLWKLKTSHT